MMIWTEERSFDRGILETLQRAADTCLMTEGFREKEVSCMALSLQLVDPEEIRELNSRFRNVDRTTDVLSFPMFEDADELRAAIGRIKADRDHSCEDRDGQDGLDEMELPVGDVVICREKIRQQAEEYGHSEERELVYLFVHSVLHLLGYDHMEEEEKAEMRRREEDVMDRLGIRR